MKNAGNVNVSSEEEVPGCLIHCEPREDKRRETSESGITGVHRSRYLVTFNCADLI